MRSPSLTRPLRILLPGTLLALAACQTDQSRPPSPPPASYEKQYEKPQRAEISNEFTATAQVIAIAPGERIVTLRREDGTHFDVQAGEGVRNFDQIAVGDELRVRFKEVLAAAKLPPGEPRSGQAALAAARAKPGSKPGAGVGMGVSLQVKIESIDRERGIVVFSLASGELIAHRVQTPEGRDVVKSLAIGDLVQLDYGRALALTVEEL
jgi:hypothetical protein